VKFEDLTDYNVWDISKLWLTKRQAISIFVRWQLWSGLFNKIEPVQWAKKNILAMKEKWYKFYAITARLTIVKPDTILWLNKHFYWCFEKVIFANFFTRWEKKKSDICKEIWASVIIEDNLETCRDCANQWIKCYLFDKPRNQCENLPENIKRVYNWNEVDL
jgi:uncharacterized HAD superfamily protein